MTRYQCPRCKTISTRLYTDDDKLKKEKSFMALSMTNPRTDQITHFCLYCIFHWFSKNIPELQDFSKKNSDNETMN